MVKDYEDSYDDDVYVPDEEEQREINEVLNREENEQVVETQPNYKNRIYHYFKDESHWAGWLRVNGIQW